MRKFAIRLELCTESMLNYVQDRVFFSHPKLYNIRVKVTLKLFPFSDWRHVCIDIKQYLLSIQKKSFSECNNLIWIKAEFSFVLRFVLF